MEEITDHQAIEYALRYGTDKNCNHLQSPQAVRNERRQIFLVERNRLACPDCAGVREYAATA